VAAVEGECTGGGFQLVLLCDARIAERKAIFQLNEVKLGFLPGMATFRLAKYIGLGRAKNIILTGRRLKAQEAFDWGILDRVCEKTEFESSLQEKIDSLLPFHPVALEMCRRLVNESYAADYENFLGHFLAAQHRAINSEAFRKLILQALAGKTTED
jgi:enoyl-CoA hydratase/carnithine racemase